MYTIYKLTAPNGKVYIGKTKCSKLYTRWQYGDGYKKNKAFHEDILKYGWVNITQEILEKVEGKEESSKRERFYILKYQSNNPDKGYNIHTNLSTADVPRSYVECVETGELFKTCVAAAKAKRVSPQAINTAVLHNRISCGCHWQYVNLTQNEYEHRCNLTKK